MSLSKADSTKPFIFFTQRTPLGLQVTTKSHTAVIASNGTEVGSEHMKWGNLEGYIKENALTKSSVAQHSCPAHHPREIARSEAEQI